MPLDFSAFDQAVTGIKSQAAAMERNYLTQIADLQAQLDAQPAPAPAPEPSPTPAPAPTPSPSPSISPVRYANNAIITLGGNSHSLQSPDKDWSFAADLAKNYARFELRGGDRWINDINNFPNDARQRCELRHRLALPFNTDIWMAGSVRAVYDTLKPGEYNIITQFHQEGDGSPPLGFSISDGSLRIYTRGSLSTTWSGTPSATTRYSTPWPVGKWVHLVCRMRFSLASPTGQLQIWRDGQQVANATGIVLGYNDTASKPYQKFGLYRSGWSDSMVVEWANRECGTTSLLSRVSSPLPVPA